MQKKKHFFFCIVEWQYLRQQPGYDEVSEKSNLWVTFLSDKDRYVSLVDKCGDSLSAVVVLPGAIVFPSACRLWQVSLPFRHARLSYGTDE